MTEIACRTQFTAFHGTRQVQESLFTVEATVVGPIRNGLVLGFDDREHSDRLRQEAEVLRGQYLDDIVGRATLEDIASYFIHQLAELPLNCVRVTVDSGWAEVAANELTKDYGGMLFFDRAVSLLLRDRTEEALRLFDECVAIIPNARVYNARGRCLRRLGNLEGALNEYGRAIAADPNCGDARTGVEPRPPCRPNLSHPQSRTPRRNASFTCRRRPTPQGHSIRPRSVQAPTAL